jgi:REP-associated tyrosine transposase
MPDKYQDKYRIPSARLASWNYSSNGAYFITICTAHREHYFGKIINGKMQLSEQGKMANHYWSQIPGHFSFIVLDEFVVMPNHIHGIVVIDKPDSFDGIGVETLHATSLPEPPIKNEQMANISPKPHSIPTIIRSFKSAVTKYCNENNLQFGWQTRFHDHIIRDNDEFERIKNYIICNPLNWEKDKFFKN